MSVEMLCEELKALAMDQGAGDVGFADLSVLKENPEYNIDARGFSSALSVVVPLSSGIMAEMDTAPTITYFAHYRAVNRLIDHITLRLCLRLEQRGYPAYAVPASQSDPDRDYAGVFPHKTAAVLAGLGSIGKNALFIHQHFGAAVRLGTVLTALPVPGKAIQDAPCGSCTRCRDHCPAMAIEGHSWTPGTPRSVLIDVRACSMYMKENWQHIGRGSVCGLCMTCCPLSGIHRSIKNNEK